MAETNSKKVTKADTVEGEAKKREDTPTEANESKVAKAGKRSKKGQSESEEKAKKLEKQKSSDSDDLNEEKLTSSQPQKPAGPKIERQGKKLREAAKKIDKNNTYSLDEALNLAKETSTTKFDSSVEVHIRLSVDPKQADQNIRDSVVLPSGTGKKVRVAVFTDDENLPKAKKAGADIFGADDFLKQLDKEQIDFDVLIASPNVMAKLAKYAKLLGPKGLMPNPKSGTVTANIETAVSQAKAGRIEYRVDSNGIIHCAIGKVSFTKDQLESNAKALFSSIKQNKPASVKSGFVKTIYLTTSMGPSIRVTASELS